ncbi:hypothetical protein EV1_038104 [Malus domestica]
MSSMLVSEDKSHEELRWEYYQFRNIIMRGDFYELVALPLYEMQVASVVQQAFLVRIIWDSWTQMSIHRGGAAPWIQYGLSTMPLM